MIARNDLLETRKDSPAGCVMNTATIIVDIFITCINTCKDKCSYKRRLYREPQKINNSALPGNAWAGVPWKMAYEQWYKRCGFASYSSVSVRSCSFAHICSRIILGLAVVWFQFSLLNMPFYSHDSVNTDMRFIMVR